jgi:hypothetical protein
LIVAGESAVISNVWRPWKRTTTEAAIVKENVAPCGMEVKFLAENPEMLIAWAVPVASQDMRQKDWPASGCLGVFSKTNSYVKTCES